MLLCSDCVTGAGAFSSPWRQRPRRCASADTVGAQCCDHVVFATRSCHVGVVGARWYDPGTYGGHVVMQWLNEFNASKAWGVWGFFSWVPAG